MNHRNLVIVCCHGLRSDALSDEARWPLVTPNLEQLAYRGLRVVAQSASPDDPMGLRCLLTGRYPRQMPAGNGGISGVLGWLRKAGYWLAGVGQVGAVRHELDVAHETAELDTPEPVGCAYMQEAHLRGHVPALRHQRLQRRRRGAVEPDRLMLEPDHDIDGFIALRAKDAVSQLPGDRPWALVVVFSGPGNDLPPPMLYDDLIDPGELRGDYVPADLTRIDTMVDPAYPRSVLQRLTPADVARIRADYLGRVALIDHGVGQLLETLRRREDARRSWCVLSSDRGVLLGEHGLLGHRSFLGPALGVPIIVTPVHGRHNPGVVPDGLWSTVDVAPTIADLAGVDVPPNTAGRSLLPLLRDETSLGLHGAWALSEFGDRLMIETRRHKAMYRTDTADCFAFYDLTADPDEHTNRVNEPCEREAKDAVRSALAEALLPLRA
jgi:arylsulfatase A-like enzyme